MVAPLLAAGAAGAAVPALDAGVKLATSVTAQLGAALGHPVLRRSTTERRISKRGERVTTTEASVPAWLIAAGAVAAVLIVREEMERERWEPGDPKLGRPWWWLPWWPWPPPDTGFPFA